MTARLGALSLLVAAGACRCGGTAPAPAAETSDVVVTVRPATEGGWLVTWDGRRPRELTVPPDAGALGALASSLAHDHPPAATAVSLAAASDIPARAVEVVASALRGHGFAGVRVVRDDGGVGGR